jgi:hypothetical protein
MTAEVFQTQNIRAAMLAVLAFPLYSSDRDAFCEVNSLMRLMSLAQTSSFQGTVFGPRRYEDRHL